MNKIKWAFCNHRHVSLLLLAAITMFSCEKIMPEKYSGEDFLYFKNTVPNPYVPDNVMNMRYYFAPEITYSSLLVKYQKDTIYVNVGAEFKLSIEADGKLMDAKRKVLVYMEGNGKEYCVLPHPDSIYIPANGTSYKLNLKLGRPPLTDTTKKKITLWLKNNDHFTPENHIWHSITYTFGNWFDVPDNYLKAAAIFGAFSPEKMQAIQKAVDREDASTWNADADIIYLNEQQKRRNLPIVNFDDFDMSALYIFCDILTPSQGPVLDAHNAVSKRMRAVTIQYLNEMAMAGTPVVDADGNKINFPE